ncbi:uncharacterized protein L969DRAFT_86189 [Mixia osmundae IAM 14324]|uniref:L-lactate dehydrogenase (cytochrome) n=1 Tax=Mixia osmundae (strain CBS 9802 / IAM 14324 / JCM 22182 / KY 12970) TaxID=764103 RepID=G7DWC8_MIXOS|nr:uncharacterized protein L969DRAFT_86189 [Mixia osmundae IAM 14324]KEI40937.1 hypothetical protein L969DRAFT_86189 [Mixia osmundae IAM 14324]GAA94888.1 hypothetical protein E5Q_01543 [Mixia osmundae IAM 14324]
MLSGEEVAKHTSDEDLWVIVHGEAFNVSSFLAEHPGGPAIIRKYAGKDATAAYEPIHPPNAINDFLPKEHHLGKVDMSTVVVEAKEETEEDRARQKRAEEKPALDELLNLFDFEAVAKGIMTPQAWAYYSSGADDEITMRENHSAYQRIWFRPRILRDVTNIDHSTTMLGTKCSLPIYITATALGKLGHPDGELNLTRAAARQDVIQMIPTLASCSFDEIVDEAQPGQTQWMQLYVNKDRAITEKIIRRAEDRGIKGLFITVDAPQLGRREKDMRMKFADEGSNVQKGDGTVDKSQGAARAISSFIDPGLCWDDIAWLKGVTRMPLVLKGVQTWEDAVLAAEAGLAGVVLSNHGGRQLDFARSGIEVLEEVMTELRKRNLVKPTFEVYIDGGVRRASDVLKAVALGAKGVGIGRPFLYAYSAYGPDGVVKAIQILKDEMTMNMRLLGSPSISDVTRDMVDVSALQSHSGNVPMDELFKRSYEPLPNVMSKSKL